MENPINIDGLGVWNPHITNDHVVGKQTTGQWGYDRGDNHLPFFDFRYGF